MFKFLPAHKKVRKVYFGQCVCIPESDQVVLHFVLILVSEDVRVDGDVLVIAVVKTGHDARGRRLRRRGHHRLEGGVGHLQHWGCVLVDPLVWLCKKLKLLFLLIHIFFNFRIQLARTL